MADIGEKNYLMSGVAQESTSNEIKNLVQNIKPGGDAKESSVQEVLTKLNELASNSSDDLAILLSSKIVCRGSVGTKFTIKRTDAYYPDIITEITPNSKKISDYFYAEIIAVPIGSYMIIVTIDGKNYTSSVDANTIGQHYTFGYETDYTLLKEITASGSYTIPSDLPYVFVTAIGGGGGGGAGGYQDSNAKGGPGGGGGGAGESVQYLKVETRSFQITIGTGGAGGTADGTTNNNGSAGSATVVGNIVTVAGGVGGTKGGRGNISGGAGGSIGGGTGGTGGTTGSGSSGSKGVLGGAGGVGGTNKNSTGGTNAAATYYHGGGGGGGGGIGAGGKGGNAASGNGSNGGIGAGGGGGAAGPSTLTGRNGGNGGNGCVRIYKGVKFE